MPLRGFDNHTITAVVNKRRPFVSRFVNAFPNKVSVATSSVQVDYIDGPEGLMLAISTNAPSERKTNRNVETKSYVLPRYSEHDFVTLEEQTAFRAPGVMNGGEAFDQLVVSKLDNLRRRIDRTRDFQAIGALQGQVVDGSGRVIATYPVPSAVTEDLTNADINSILDKASVAISRALGFDVGGLVIHAGVTAYRALLENASIREMLKGTQAGVNLVQTGKLELVGGHVIERVSGVYKDDEGDDQTWLADNKVVITSPNMATQEVFGPMAAQGGRMFIGQFYAEQTEERDPNLTKIRVEARPLPLVNRPDGIYQINHVVD